MLTLPKIYPVTDTKVSGLSHIEQVRRLIEGGASFIQLRDKTSPTGAFYDAAVEVVTFARKHDVRIIINDRVDVALLAEADGVHLGQEDLSPVDARRLLGDRKIIGYSTHSIEQASEALNLPVDYIAIGPVFPTVTKHDHEPAVGLSIVRSVRDRIGNLPLVAIGGINETNAASVFSAGADTLAVIGDLLSNPEDIATRMREFPTRPF